jgi:glycine betaine/choline ABC-type transport system substrate-binding protein
MRRLLDNLLRAAGVGAILYGVYKLGEKNALRSMEQEQPPLKIEEKPKTESEVISDMIEELKQKPNKTRKDKDNIELLEIKLKQVKNQK